MSAWRHQAFEQLPEFRTTLQEAENPYAYWIELQLHFADVCRDENVDLAQRILAYADWCLDQPRGITAADDLMTCVHFCFLEHLPEIASSQKCRSTFLEAAKKTRGPFPEEYFQGL